MTKPAGLITSMVDQISLLYRCTGNIIMNGEWPWFRRCGAIVP
jgi:hypothetical protein